ncbi:MAG: LamG domain-containing protein [Acidobacteriota bacterium]|nr:LamG domain-containing protein [Acidobacteriota bacterium]
MSTEQQIEMCAIQLAGGADHMRCANSAALSVTGDLTIEVWFRSSAALSGKCLLSKHYNCEYDLTFWGGLLKYYHGPNHHDNEFASGTQFVPDQWYHLALTRNNAGREAILYVNGVRDQVHSYGTEAPTSNHDLHIGARPGGKVPFTGQIGELRLWSTVRDEAAINEFKNRALSGDEPGLIGYWNFREQGGTAVSDLSPHGHHGTLYGNPTRVAHTGVMLTPAGATSPAPPAEPVEPPAEPVEPPAEPVEPPTEPVEPPAEPVEPPAEEVPTAEAELVLALPTDELEPAVGDLAFDATLRGALIAPDDVLGSCIGFDGVDDRVDITPDLPASVAATFAAWIRPASRVGWQPVFDLGNGARRLGLVNDQLSFQSGNQNTVVAETLPANTWCHVALVVSAGDYLLYLNGRQAARRAVSLPAAGGTLTLGADADDAHYEGELAAVRIYDRALTPEQVQTVMHEARAARVAFKDEYPLDFQLWDGDEQNILYMADETGNQRVILELVNTSNQQLEWRPTGNNVPGRDNYHLRLTFKPQTFREVPTDPLQYIRAGELPPDWIAAAAEKDPEDGKISLRLLYRGNQPLTLGVEQSLSFTLEYRSAGGGYARGTNVALSYQRLYYRNAEAEIAGTRMRAVDIINQRGKKHIPLQVGIVGANTILNDAPSEAAGSGTAGCLRIRMINIAKVDPANRDKGRILFETGQLNQERNTSFRFVFDDPPEDEWDLASEDQLKAIEITYTRHTWDDAGDLQPSNPASLDMNDTGTSPVFTFEPDPAEGSLKAGEYIDFQLSNIRSNAVSGFANIYLLYEDVPGYWDGRFAIQVEKTPIVHKRFGNSNNVGIGITPNDSRLRVAGKTTIEGDLYANRLVDRNHVGRYVDPSSTSVLNGLRVHGGTTVDTLTGTSLTINGHATVNGNADVNTLTSESATVSEALGIGTDDPQDKLDIRGGGLCFEGKTEMKLFGAVRHDLNAVVLKGAKDELEVMGRFIEWKGGDLRIGHLQDHSNHSVVFGTGKTGKKLKALIIKGEATFVMENGKQGIGTNDPKASLHIKCGSSGQTPTGINNVFLENNGTSNSCYVFQTATSGGGKSFSITNAGRVGINNPNPGTLFHVSSGSSDQTPQNVNNVFLENNGSSNSYYVFQTATKGGGKSFSITNAGNVGIGTTNPPTAKLEVNGSFKCNGKGAIQNIRVGHYNSSQGAGAIGGGWYRIGGDLNAGSGGSYIYLEVQYTD